MGLKTDNNKNSHLVMIVPIEYNFGIAGGAQTYFDSGDRVDGLNMRMDTFALSAGASIGLKVARPVDADFFYWHGVTTVMDLPVQIFADDNNIPLFTTLFTTERGSAGSFSFPNASGIQKTTDIEADNLLVKMDSESVEYSEWRMTSLDDDIITFKNLCWSQDHALRMYDRDVSWEYSFGKLPAPGKSPQGLSQILFNVSKQNQIQKKWKLSWKGLRQTQYDEFIDFFRAFGDDVSQPFFMCVIHGDSPDNEMTSSLLSIQPETIKIARKVKAEGVWDISFTAVELLVDF